MNKSEYFNILQNLNSLYTYSDLLPDDFKTNFLTDLDDLKKEISKVKTNVDKVPEQSKVLPPPVIIPEPEDSSNKQTIVLTSTTKATQFATEGKSFLNFKKNDQSEEDDEFNYLMPNDKNFKSKIELAAERNYFFPVLESLVPKLTDEGRKLVSDLDSPVDLYKFLKIVDERTSFYELYRLHSHNFKDFIDFALKIHQHVERERNLIFVKTKNPMPNKGWIKLGDFFSETKLISSEQLEKALEYKKGKKTILIGQALFEQRFISEDYLRETLKLQRWISKIAESSPFVKTLSKTELPLSSEKIPDKKFFQMSWILLFLPLMPKESL